MMRLSTAAPITAVIALAAATLLTLGAPAAAQVTIFDNGTPDGSRFVVSDPGSSQFLADTFTFTASTQFNQVQWFGGYVRTDTPLTGGDNFTLAFYNTTTGRPNSAAISGLTFSVGDVGRVDTGQVGGAASPFRIYRYVVTLPSTLTFTAGTYGLGIVNDTANDTDDDWAWASSSPDDPQFLRTSPTGTYNSIPFGNLAFQLQQTQVTTPVAPEPGSLALLLPLLGGLGIAAQQTRRRRK